MGLTCLYVLVSVDLCLGLACPLLLPCFCLRGIFVVCWLLYCTFDFVGGWLVGVLLVWYYVLFLFCRVLICLC